MAIKGMIGSMVDEFSSRLNPGNGAATIQNGNSAKGVGSGPIGSSLGNIMKSQGNSWGLGAIRNNIESGNVPTSSYMGGAQINPQEQTPAGVLDLSSYGLGKIGLSGLSGYRL